MVLSSPSPSTAPRDDMTMPLSLAQRQRQLPGVQFEPSLYQPVWLTHANDRTDGRPQHNDAQPLRPTTTPPIDTSVLPQRYRIQVWSVLYKSILYIICFVARLDYTQYSNWFRTFSSDITIPTTSSEQHPRRTSIIGVLQLFLRLYISTVVTTYIVHTILDPLIADTLPVLWSLLSALLCACDFLYGNFRVECVFPSFVVSTAFPSLIREETVMIFFRLLLEQLPTPQRPITKMVSNHQYRVISAVTQPLVLRPFHAGRPPLLPPHQLQALGISSSYGGPSAPSSLWGFSPYGYDTGSHHHTIRSLGTSSQPSPSPESRPLVAGSAGAAVDPAIPIDQQSRDPLLSPSISPVPSSHERRTNRQGSDPHRVSVSFLIIRTTLLLLISLIQSIECVFHRFGHPDSQLACSTAQSLLYSDSKDIHRKINRLQRRITRQHDQIIQTRADIAAYARQNGHNCCGAGSQSSSSSPLQKGNTPNESLSASNNHDVSADKNTTQSIYIPVKTNDAPPAAPTPVLQELDAIPHELSGSGMGHLHQHYSMLFEGLHDQLIQIRMLYTKIHMLEQFSFYLDRKAHSSTRFALTSIVRWLDRSYLKLIFQ